MSQLYSAPYHVLSRHSKKMDSIFKKHSLEWEVEEVLTTDDNGNPKEVAGTLTGELHNLKSFFKGAGFSVSEVTAMVTKYDNT